MIAVICFAALGLIPGPPNAQTCVAVLGHVSLGDAQEEPSIELARAQLENGDLALADSTVREFLALQPSSSQGLSLLGDILYNRSLAAEGSVFGGRQVAQVYRAEAKESWMSAIALSDAPIGAYVSLGVALRDAGELERAKEIANQGLAAFEENDLNGIDLHWLLAEIAREKRDFKTALIHAELVLNRQASHFECELIELESNVKTGHWEKGAKRLEILADRHGTGSELSFRLWSLYGAHGNFKDSSRIYELLTQHLKDNASAWFHLGASRQRAGEFALAVDPLERALSLDPTLDAARHEKGLALFGCERFEEALVAFEEVAREDREFKTTVLDDLSALGAFVAGRYQFALAEHCFNLVREIDPGRMSAAVNLALAQRQGGKLEEAIETYRRARDDFPEHPVILNDLGLVYFGQGQLEEASKLFEAAAALGQIDSHENLAMIAYSERKFDQALAHLRRVLELDPQRVKARFYFENVKRALARES